MATRIRKTPSINLSGLYTANIPFILSNTHTHRCIAIRRFSDIEASGDKVFELYYEPNALEQDIYLEDLDAEACIITLLRSDGELLYIPDTFIASFPLMKGVNYVRASLLVDMGVIPEHVDFEFVKAQVLQLVKTVVNPPSAKVELATLPVRNTISISDQDSLEAARLASIAINDTDYSKRIALENEVASLRQVIEDQNAKIIAAGIGS